MKNKTVTFVSAEMERAYRRLVHFCSRNRMKVVAEYDDAPWYERTRVTIVSESFPSLSVMGGHPESVGDLEDYFKQAKIFANA